MRAFQALARFDVTRPFAPWIKRITANLCLNWLESERVRPQLTAADMAQADETPADMDQLAQETATPEQLMIRQEQATRLRAAILQLIRAELVHQTDPAAFLMLIDKDSAAFLTDGISRKFELGAAIAAQAMENITRETL